MRRLASLAVFFVCPAAFAQGEAPTPTTELVLKYLVAPALPLLFSALLALLAMGVRWLKEKGSASKTHRVLGVLAELVEAEVRNLEVTMRPLLGKALEDGRLSADEKVKLRQEAMGRVKASLPASLRKAAEELLGPALEGWLLGQVERAHAALPAGRGEPSDALPTPPARPSALAPSPS